MKALAAFLFLAFLPMQTRAFERKSFTGSTASTVTFSSLGAYVVKTGDTMTGTLNVSSTVIVASTLTVQGNAFSVGRSTLAVVDSIILIGTTTQIPNLANPQLTVYNQAAGNTSMLLASESAALYRGASYAAGGTGTQYIMQRFNGTAQVPTVVSDSQSLGLIRATGYTGTTSPAIADILLTLETGVNSTSMPTSILFKTTRPQAVAVTTAMVITSTGNVGIGTTSPGTLLHMSSGTLTIDGNVANGISLIGSSMTVTGGGGVKISTGFAIIDGGNSTGGTKLLITDGIAGNGIVGALTGNLLIGSNSAGAVGIGLYNAYTIDFRNPANNGYSAELGLNSSSVFNAYYPNVGAFKISDYNSATTDIFVKRALAPGLVGINTATPGTTLDVNGGFNVSSTSTFVGAVTVGTFTISAIQPPDSQALCIKSGAIGHCTGLVGASGGCTCVAP